jgi:hypothetical protein
MIKAYQDSLKATYPNMIHVTCLAHGIHGVAEKIRSLCPKIDKLISNVKKIFKKSPIRREIFEEHAPGLSFPPQPVLTRWGTWLQAASYYSENLTVIKFVISKLDSEDAVAIRNAKKVMDNPSLQTDLAYVAANFSYIPILIKKLEKRDIELADILTEFESTTTTLSQCRGPLGKAVKDKISFHKGKNDGLNLLLKISKVIQGGQVDNSFIKHYTPDQIASYKFAPVTSCDVERSFSIYKNIFRDNRHQYKFDNLKKVVMINFNLI